MIELSSFYVIILLLRDHLLILVFIGQFCHYIF